MGLEKTSSKTKMSWLIIIISALAWLVSFTYSTGYGEKHDIFENARNIVVIIFIASLMFRKKAYKLTLGMVFSGAALLFISFLNDQIHGDSMYDYLWVWLLIPLISALKLEERQMKWIGYGYGIASTAVLLIGNVTEVFDGWDGNSVSIVQFFSYTVFISIFSEIKGKNIRKLVIFSIAYFYLLSTFGSRSSILFSTIMLLCMLSIIPLRKMLNRFSIFVILMVPLIIAVLIVSVHEMEFVEALNDWSLNTFGKPIFNGRDYIWEGGFEKWMDSPLIGYGNLSYAGYHNSAISLLVGSGIIGFVMITGLCYNILSKSLKWIKDSTVYGLTASFLIIWMQQSVELGIISAKPVVLPYMILGLLFARIRTLEGESNEIVNNIAGI